MIGNQDGTTAIQVWIVKANNQAYFTKWSNMDILTEAVVSPVINLNWFESRSRNKWNEVPNLDFRLFELNRFSFFIQDAEIVGTDIPVDFQDTNPLFVMFGQQFKQFRR